MSTPVVVIGFILLIPCVLAMITGLFIILGGATIGGAGVAASNSTTVSARVKREASRSMAAAGVRREIIIAVLNGDNDKVEAWLNEDPDVYGRITFVEEQAVREAQREIAEPARERGASPALIGGAFVGGVGVVMTVGCFVGGLLGWLLVMRKRVLQCGLCGAVVNAS